MKAMPKYLRNSLKPLALPVMLALHQQLLHSFLSGYVARRVGSRGHEELSVDQSLAAIHLFIRFTKKPPWLVTDEDWDQWSLDLAGRGLARTTVRGYQTAVVGFLQYCEGSSLNDELEAKVKFRVRCFVTPDMLVRHVDERADGRRRPCISPEHLDALIEHMANSANAHDSGDRHQLAALVRRDQVMTMVLFRYGLRISEALSLDLDSFQVNPDAPEFGKFGLLTVWGKGHHGSGKIPREVPTLHRETSIILSDYIARTRPHLTDDPAVGALFLSSHGTRLSAEEFRARFRGYWHELGLGDRGYTPHCLRHSSITEQLIDGHPLMFVSRFHGHKLTSTTDKYTHFSSTYVRAQVKRIVGAQLKRRFEANRKNGEADAK